MSNCFAPRTRFASIGVLAGTVGLVLLATAACGGSPPSSASSSSSGSSSAAGTGGALSAYISHVLAYARCVRSHGVPNFPDPDSSGHFNKELIRQLAVSDSQLRAATSACQNLLPAGQPPLTPAQQQDYLRAAACMRSHGIANFPDPNFAGGGVTFPIPAGLDPHSQRVAQAVQICKRLIPAGLPYSGSDG